MLKVACLHHSIEIGMSMSELWPDAADKGNDDVLYHYGYNVDRINELCAVRTLLSEQTPPSHLFAQLQIQIVAANLLLSRLTVLNLMPRKI